MSDRFTDRAELAAKIAWEGGNWSALEYGIRAEHMPEGDTELRLAWQRLRDAFKLAERAWEVVDELLPDPGEDGEDDDG